jgi:hypothetical protein
MASATCTGTKRNGKRCTFKAKHGAFCGVHRQKEDNADGAEVTDCPICFEMVTTTNRRVLPCGHVFHGSCVKQWLRDHTTCPMCRANVSRPRARETNESAVNRELREMMDVVADRIMVATTTGATEQHVTALHRYLGTLMDRLRI